jgi:hypothetical protein
LAVAQFCLEHKKRYVAAARFFADALAADAKLAVDPTNCHRYNATCAAALAAAGKGFDASEIDEEKRTRLRKQALDWLHSDLDLWAKRLASGKPEDGVAVRQALHGWQTDADLASLRDKDELAKLSAEEKEVCRKLWAETEALLQKAGKKAK